MTRQLVVSFPPGKGGLSPEQCDQILGAMDDEKLGHGRISTTDGTNIDDSVRSGRVQWIHHQELGDEIFSHLFTLAKVVNREREWHFDLWGIARALQAVRYWGDGNQHYDWHIDWGGGAAKMRKIAVVTHLSDESDYDGGALQITNSSTPSMAMQERGTVTVFPTFLLHRVTPVWTGCRSATVSWVLGPSWR
jgi:PKHD-type hydroxylase